MNTQSPPTLPKNLELHYAGSIEQLEPYAAQLLQKSQQEHIKRFEHEDTDPLGRFSSKVALGDWMSIERAAFLLIDKSFSNSDGTGRLAGMSWFSPREYPLPFDTGCDVTFGIRLYKGYAGMGLGASYVYESHKAATKYAENHGVWLSAKPGNQRAMRVYEQNGYGLRGSEDGLVYMTNQDALNPRRYGAQPLHESPVGVVS